jgi:hypothetical protein
MENNNELTQHVISKLKEKTKVSRKTFPLPPTVSSELDILLSRCLALVEAKLTP